MFSVVCWTRFGQMLRVRLEKMSSYVGSLAASRVHHDRKVQFFWLKHRNAEPSLLWDVAAVWYCAGLVTRGF